MTQLQTGRLKQGLLTAAKVSSTDSEESVDRQLTTDGDKDELRWKEDKIQVQVQ